MNIIRKNEDISNFPIKIYIYSIDKCSWCKRLEAELPNIDTHFQQQNTPALFVKVDCDTDFDSCRYIEKYPTIEVACNSKKIEYTGDRTAVPMEEYVKSYC